ncbi:ADP-ribosyltransferase-containing protein [Bacteroides thetaiotaomicron]|jgi:hypothetical protein|uniref:ADP-ribosyltransferase-containing protein n=1 Tax=Bacteroides thetaiotaomicron TaxID=818 RepID=UPI003562584E
MRKENGTHHKVAEFKSESISQQNNEVPLTALSGLPKGNGEFCHIERIFRESGMFSFCGKEKVETADDVAYIFKELENASVENAFVVLVKESIPTIVHLGMGLFTETQVNLAAIKAAYDALGADQVYFVHNHPSGNLHCSRSDVRLLNVIADMVGNNVLREGIIINTTSGKYGTFNLKGNSEETNYPQLIRDEYPLKLYSFDKTVFSRDYDPQKLNVVHSSRDIAALISSQRLGNRQKVSYLILDHGDHIVGNLHTAFNAVSGNETKIANEIVQNTIRFGGVRAVLYGSYSLQNVNLDFLNMEVGRFSGHTVKLLDCIVADGLHTQSAIDLSLMEPTVEYKRESLQNDTNIYEMDDIRFRIEDNYTQEELLIIDLARANGMYLKAPNGEVSNLSPEQWAQVRTTAFKKWFGDWENTPENASKAIDENGEPIVVYHGSSQWFTSFKNGPEHHSDAPDKSIFMSNDRELSNSYISWYGESDGSLPPMAHDVYLNENDPRHKHYSWGVYREGGIYPLFANIKHPLIVDFEGKLWIDAGDGRDINRIVKDAQLSGGYDGVIAKNIKDVGRTDLDISEFPVSNDYVAFNSNQVKSAISNIGDFSLENNDIRFRIADNNFSSLAIIYNLEETDVKQYADSMRIGNLGGASYALINMKRKVRIDNINDSFEQFSNRLSLIKKELYENFGNIDELREEVVRNTKAEHDQMEAARIRMEKEAKVERERLQEFQDMSSGQLDKEYFTAVNDNNESRIRDLVNEAARRNGYEDVTSDYQGMGAWTAPANPGYENTQARRADVEENSPDVNIEDIAMGYSPQPDDYFTNLRAYGTDTPEGKESAKVISNAINEIHNTGSIPKIKVYRAVPTTVKENSIRNGDWVTLSKKYAEMHGNARLEGKFLLIEQEVSANELWWDGNDINEWGVDDGKGYRYKNTKNNRKLDYLITYDNKGNIIPLSQRFNSRKNDIRYRFIGEKGAANLDRVEEATFRLDNLSLAKEMEFVGKDPILIKFATGWERGADNLWRYEDRDLNIQTEYVGKYKDNRTSSNIAAYHMHNRMSVGSVGRLSDFISDDNLFMAYPEIADWEVKMLGNGAKFSGIARNGMIALSKGYFSEVYEILNLEDVTTARAKIPELYERIPEDMRELALDLVDVYGGEQDRMSDTAYSSIVELCPEIEEMIKALDDIPLEKRGEFLGYRLNDIAKRVLIHEVQHAIQHIEGFAFGGSPMQFSDSSTFEYDIRKFNSVVEDVIQGNEYEKLGELLNSDKYSGFRESFSSDRDREVIRVLKMWYSDLSEKVFMENYHYSVENGRKGTTEEQYHKLSGEVEARNVESRMKMTPEERRNSLAKLTEDVRREDQIFLKNSLSERMHSSKAEFIPAIEGLTNSMHISVNIINGINEISDSMARRKIESGSNVKGWFVPTTSTVNIYLPNISDLNDAQRTVFHEVVAHYGLRKMFGEHFDVFLDNVYNNADPVIQRKILQATNGEPNKRLMATEEYLAKLAEQGFSDPNELSLWKKIKLAFIDMLRQANVNLNFKLTDNSLRYILYKSYLNLTQDVSSNNLNLLNMEEKSNEVAQATEIYDDLDPFWQAIEDHWFPDEKESKKQEEQQEQSLNQEFRMPHTVKGVEISAENRQKLLQGERVFIEGMISSKGTPFNAYMYIDQKKKTLAFDFPEKKEKKKENIDTPQAEAIKKSKKKKLGL